MASESRVAVVAALLGNLLIAVLKLAAGLVAQSAAMLAEAAHSFSDVGNQILLLVGIARANRPPSDEHPFGTGKAAYFWPFLVAILLFGVAGAYSLIEGFEKFRHPHDVGDVRLALGVLGASFAIECVSLYVAVRQAARGAKARGVRSIRQFRKENRDATLLTVIVEDSLALVGLPIAALAVGLAAWTGNGLWDAAGSMVIGLMLMGFALFLGTEVKDLLIGVGLDDRNRREVHRILCASPAVTRVHNVASMYMGPHTVLLGAELDIQPGLDSAKVTKALRELEAELTHALPQLKYVYLEPHLTPIEQVRSGSEAVGSDGFTKATRPAGR